MPTAVRAERELGLFYVKHSGIHGKGLFAGRFIPVGSFIGTLEGPRTRRDGRYVLWITEDETGETYGVRGTNDLRFANHSADPNACFDGEQMYALRDIAPDEEITFHYGAAWDDVE